MVAVREFKNIATAAAPALTDTAIGVQGGTTDVQYTFAQIQSSIVPPIRTILTGNLSLYVNASTGSDSYNGLSATYTGGVNGPKATPQGAINELSSSYDTGSFNVFIMCAAGSLAGFGGKPIVGGGIIGIIGAGRTSTSLTSGPNDGIYNTGSVAEVNVPTGARWFVDQLTLDASAGGFPGNDVFHANIYNSFVLGNLTTGSGDVGINLGNNSFNAVGGADGWAEIGDDVGGSGTTITVSGGGSAGGYFYDIETLSHGDFAGTYVFENAAVFGNFLHAGFGGILLWDATAGGPGSVADNFSSATDGGQIIDFVGGNIPGSGLVFADPSSSYNGAPTPMTVAQLTANFPAANYEGGRMFVTDSSVVTGIVSGGGSNKVPVYSDGTNWLVELGGGFPGNLIFGTASAGGSPGFVWNGSTWTLERADGAGGTQVFEWETNDSHIDFPGQVSNQAGALTLVNGLNSNINIAVFAGGDYGSYCRVSGPTGGFSLGGFLGGRNGAVLKIYNSTAQAMTIVNQDASSSAANRILTLSGSNIVLGGPSFATFVYDPTDTNWILESHS